MNRRQFRSLRSWALTGVAAAAIASPAWAQEARRFDIPQQSLVAALEAFGKQGEAEILFSRAQAEGHATPGVSGNYEPAQALAMLLDGSGLKFRQVNGNTYVVEAAAPQSGSAAGDGADAGTVQALVVTAQKREENIQDVPIAMSAFTQEDLTRSQVAGGPDLMTQVPNFTFTKTNFSSYSIQIRGIGTQAISATTDAAVAVAFNNTPFIRNRFFEQEFYDLERVEVLRGPQGTLYGRNATAGVVNIISQKPKFTYEARLSADVGNYSSQRFEGMVNVPLVDDKVALRLAGAWTKRDGYDTNQITGNQIDGRDLWSTRLSLRFAPTDHLEANLIWEHFKEDDDRLRSGKQLCHRDVLTDVNGAPVSPIGGFAQPQSVFNQGCVAASLYAPESFQAPNGYSLPYYHPLGAIFLPTVDGLDPYASVTQSRDLRVIESTVDPEYKAETDLAELQVSYDLGDALTLTSETGYLVDDLFSSEDYNRFNTTSGAWREGAVGANFERENLLVPGPHGPVFCDPQIGCADRVVAVDLSTAKSRHFSQEFRLASDYEGPFNFSLGANFLRYDTEDKYYVFINSLTLISAIAPYSPIGNVTQFLPPWQQNGSDNHECLIKGFAPPDPTGINHTAECTYIDPNPIHSLNDLGHNYFLSKNPYKLISYAVFGEAYYKLADNLKVTAGLRWTVDKKEAPSIPSWVVGSNTVGYPVVAVIEQEWREPTGRLTIDWKPDLAFSDETLLYASYAHGYKAGGANPPLAGLVTFNGFTEGRGIAFNKFAESAAHPKTFAPEFVDAFEVGAKNTLLDGQLTLNLDAFYYDYKGYQISQIVDRSATNLNFDARVWGLELESDWRPLENLRVGLKLGYENTRVADGSRAIDLMDRTAGHDDWIIVRPFPTFTSNCIVPKYVITDGTGVFPQGFVNGQPGPCEIAYYAGLDPVTWLPYVPNPTEKDPSGQTGLYPGYPGFDPTTAPNHGEGFFTDLSGNELPNAPHFTTTITGDYTIPLPNNWMMTLHSDLYYQSEAWTRIFNMPGYDKLKAYTNLNLAAIFSNEDAGWKVMAYIKNVMDRDSITGAFLNSDDTGLTTNVFLTEPRLYGLRVTKEFTGGPWWTGANPNHSGPYPLTIEIGGQVQRLDAPYDPITPSFMGEFSPALRQTGLQNRDLDWGDGRELKLTFAPQGSSWRVSAGVRYGRTNGGNARGHAEEAGDTGCLVGNTYYFPMDVCEPTYEARYQETGSYLRFSTNWSDAAIVNRENHVIADFEVGRDMGLGLLREGTKSQLSAGLRYASFRSETELDFAGVPDWYLPDAWLVFKYAEHHRYAANLTARRDFKGMGPTLSWETSHRLLGDEKAGHLDVDWSLKAGALFGKQTSSTSGKETAAFYSDKYQHNPAHQLGPTIVTPGPDARSKSVTVPMLDLSLGLSYEVQRFKIGGGYRWERYFNALDAGYDKRREVDRTIDGPYLKIAVGFGG